MIIQHRCHLLRAAGPLCLGKHAGTKDRRLDDTFPTFKKFNRTLRWTCEDGDAAVLEITPNSSWPDTVYYNSFTHANMGWKIHIVDTYPRPGSVTGERSTSWDGRMVLMLIGVAIAVLVMVSVAVAVVAGRFKQ